MNSSADEQYIEILNSRVKELQEKISKIQSKSKHGIDPFNNNAIKIKGYEIEIKELETEIKNKTPRAKLSDGVEDILYDLCVHCYYYQLSTISHILFEDCNPTYSLLVTSCISVIFEVESSGVMSLFANTKELFVNKLQQITTLAIALFSVLFFVLILIPFVFASFNYIISYLS
jgi:hypothetical protein